MVSQYLEYCSRKVTHFLKYPTMVISFHGQIVPSQIALINSEIVPQNGQFVPQKKSVRPTYSYFEKGCRKKCTRQFRKVLWVVFSSLFFKEISNNGKRGHGRMFASAKGKQQK